MNPLVEQFISEARDNLSYLDAHLQELQNEDEEVVNSLFRAAHTLKGGAGLLGFDAVKEITHAAEDLLDAYRNKKIGFSQEMLDALYLAFDEVVELVDALEESGEVTFSVDKERIEGIKQSILEYLSGDDTKKSGASQEEAVSLPFEINTDVATELLRIDTLDLSALELFASKITQEFVTTKQLWVVDLDLDTDTLHLGNDPFYLLSMLGRENIKAIGCEVGDFRELVKDPLVWSTRIQAVIETTPQALEDAFYNVLDEVAIAPLSLDTLLCSSYEGCEKEALEQFCQEVNKDASPQEIAHAASKLQARTKEGFALKRALACASTGISQEIVHHAVKKIGCAYETSSAQEMPDEPQTNETHKTKPSSVPKTIKIDQKEIDYLMDIIGEILVVKNSLPYIAQQIDEKLSVNAKRALLNKYEDIDRITSQLQERIMGMRLLPISYIFNRYPKLVRDISRQLDKEIRYEEFGADTRLDKMIIERLADPLVHIIRNSLDHGAESKSERLACNKEQKALLRVGAKSEGDRVVIIIEDDGRGIDADKVVQKALDKGLVDAEALEKMSQKEKLQLIFLPGLSTKEEISELSGRGVGTDAVRSIIYELGGKIEVASELSKGTKTTIEIPISVALSSVFHVMLGNTNFAINMECISETVKVEAKAIEYINEQPVLKLRGALIPLVFYYDLLSKDIKEKSEYSLLIIESGGVKFGFVVDAFVSQLDIVQKPPSSYLANHRFISGTSLLGNGEVLFLINASKLIMKKEK